MNRTMLLVAISLLFGAAVLADETKIDSHIDSVGLFKNGLAVVERSATLSGPGVFRIEDVPTPVHGTFWIESPVAVETQVTMRDVAAPARSKATIDFQEELVGSDVTIHLHDGQLPAVTGRVVELARPKGDDAWNRTYVQPQYYGNNNQQVGPGTFLVLETVRGRVFVDTSQISFVEATGAGADVHQRQPVLLLTTAGDVKAPVNVRISYLTKGLSWAPAYRVNLTDDKTLSIEQQATIKNELTDLTDAEFRLISGFPSVQFAHVTSPLALSQTWTEFFAQLNMNPREIGGAASNSMSQQAVMANAPGGGAEGIDLAAGPAVEEGDLHYQTIGKRSLAEGDALALPVAKAEASYERIVEWIVPDTRDVDGRFIEDYRRRDEPEKFQDSAWDAVRFKNPLPFAMTTGPAMVLDGGKFAGQRMTPWVSPGELTTLQINKALSLRTHAVEQEDASGGDRPTLAIGGRQYRKVSVRGELTVVNRRDHEINLVIRRQFSGDLVKADGEPKTVLREEGVYSVNRRNELTWTMPLKSAETKTLVYQYTVLVAE